MNCAVHARKPTLWCLARCEYCEISLDEGNLVLYRPRQLPTRLLSRAAFASPTKREETFMSSTVEVSMQKKTSETTPCPIFSTLSKQCTTTHRKLKPHFSFGSQSTTVVPRLPSAKNSLLTHWHIYLSDLIIMVNVLINRFLPLCNSLQRIPI